jgi:hypothetical protein
LPVVSGFRQFGNRSFASVAQVNSPDSRMFLLLGIGCWGSTDRKTGLAQRR